MRRLLPLLLLLAACPPTPEPVAAVQSLRLDPAELELPRGRSASVRALAVYDDGTEQDVTAAATWSSAAPWQATVEVGLVTALEQGTGAVSASWEGFTGASTLTVGAPAVDALVVAPAAPSIPVGLPLELRAVARTSDGADLDVTDGTTWTAEPAEVLTVDADGVLVGLQAGTGTVRATYFEAELLVSVEVTDATIAAVRLDGDEGELPLGFDRPLAFVATLSDGSEQDLTGQAQWTSSNPAIATVGPLSGDPAGRVVSVAAGSAIIEAEWDGFAAERVIEVGPAVPTALLVATDASEIPLGGLGQAAATATYSDGSTDDVTAETTWLTTPAGVLLVSHDAGREGELVPLTSGTATVTGRWLDFEHSDNVEVLPAEPSGLTLDAAVVSLEVGQGQQLLATGGFGDGSSVDATTAASWSSDAPTVVTVASGWLTPVGPGTATVQADWNGFVAAATVGVDPAGLVSLVVSSPPALAVGQEASLTATGTYSDGAVLDVTAQAFWSSSTPAVATVSNSPGRRGRVLAAGAGSTTILASLASVQAAATVPVDPAAPTALTVAPGDGAVVAGEALALTASVSWTDGAMTDETATTLWSSADPTVATASNDAGVQGTVTGVALGATTVSATFGAVGDAVAVQVTDAPTGLAIEPDPLVLRSCVPVQLTAVASFAAEPDAALTGGVAWSSSDAVVGFAAEDPGIAEPVGQGSATIGVAYGGSNAVATAWVHPRGLRGDWFVAPDGDDGDPGTEAEPFGTLAHALSVATSGDVVQAGPGAYVGPVVVPAGVTLFAVDGPAATEVSATGGCGCATVTLDAGASLVGLSVVGGEDASIATASDAVVLGCLVLPGAAADAGVEALAGAQLDLRASTVHGPGSFGVVAEAGATVVVQDSVVDGFAVWGLGNGQGTWTVQDSHVDSIAIAIGGPDVVVGQDPQLLDPGAGDYTPAPGSPLIDAGGAEGPDADCSPQDRGALPAN